MAASAVACWKSCISAMPLPCFFNFAITACLTCSGLRILKSKESKSVEKIAMLRLPQGREAEIGRGRPADRPAHGADPLLDLVLGVVLHGLHLAVDQALPLGFRQILVAPGVGADGMSGGGHLLEDAGLVGGMGADREEDRLGAVCGKRGEHGGRVLGPWTIQHV